jgi:DNA-binding CsgD family transcriptional regulator
MRSHRAHRGHPAPVAAAGDPIEVLEIAYHLDATDEVWLARVLGALHPIIDRGLGSVAYFFVIDERGAIDIRSPMVKGLFVPLEVVRDYNLSLSPERVASLYLEAPPCGTAAAALRCSLRREEVYNRTIRPHVDVPDALGLRGNSAPREGVFFTAPIAKARAPRPAEAVLLSRLGAHLGAGLRLRRRLGAGVAQRLDDAEAILTPGGHLVHAAKTAQSAKDRRTLTEAARTIDRARGRLRRADPDEAVALWCALWGGRWSLVDHFDCDGRRFLVAHHNLLVDSSPHVRALSEREQQAARLAALGHSNHLIAYELGVSPTTVSEHLAGAARKLGAGTRAALVQALRAPSPD